MRILLPLTQDPRGGIGRVATTLARALPDALGPDDRLVLFGDARQPVRHPQVDFHGGTQPRSGRQRFVQEQIAFRALAASADLVHLPDHRPVLASRARFVITLHDLAFLDHPDWYPPHIVLYKRVMLRAALTKRPAAIVADSAWCMERFRALFPTLPSRTVLRVIPPGLEVPAPTRAAGTRAREPYFLTVSAIEARKNHLGLLAAFTRARAQGLALRWKVVGRPIYRGEEILRRLRATPGVETLGSVSQPELESLYSGAEFVATPSWEEGFGYPPLEAMARGVPALCSTGSALDETVGDAALRVPAGDAEEWAQALLRLQADGALRERLVARGKQRLTRFTPAASARAHVDLFHQLHE